MKYCDHEALWGFQSRAGCRATAEGGKEGGRRVAGETVLWSSGCVLSHMTNLFLWPQSSDEINVLVLKLLPEFVIILL